MRNHDNLTIHNTSVSSVQRSVIWHHIQLDSLVLVFDAGKHRIRGAKSSGTLSSLSSTQVTLYHLLKLFQSDSSAMPKKTVVSEFYDEMVRPRLGHAPTESTPTCLYITLFITDVVVFYRSYIILKCFVVFRSFRIQQR